MKGHKSVGGYIGAAPSYLRAGVLRESTRPVWEIPTYGQVLYLDAGNPASYSGSGTAWYDMSGNGNTFTLDNASAFNSSGPKYTDFNGTYGATKKTSGTDISLSNTVTYVLWTRVKNSTSDWRTLTRAMSGTNNHHVIFQTGTWNLGMYNNSGVNSPAGYNDSGYLQTSLPNYGTTNWICMYWRFYGSAPYYQMSYNDTPGTIRASISSTGSIYGTTGFGSLGAYMGTWASPTTASQFWGDISSFAVYNRDLTDAELLQFFNATRGRYGV